CRLSRFWRGRGGCVRSLHAACAGIGYRRQSAPCRTRGPCPRSWGSTFLLSWSRAPATQLDVFSATRELEVRLWAPRLAGETDRMGGRAGPEMFALEQMAALAETEGHRCFGDSGVRDEHTPAVYARINNVLQCLGEIFERADGNRGGLEFARLEQSEDLTHT